MMKFSHQTEQDDTKNNSNLLDLKLQFTQYNQTQVSVPSPMNTKNQTVQTQPKTTPMNNRYKFESFSNTCSQQSFNAQQQTSHGNSIIHKSNSNYQLNSTNLNHHRKQSALSKNSQDLSQPTSTPTNKQIKEYISKNSIAGMLGVKQQKKDIFDKKTLSQFSKIQQKLNIQDNSQNNDGNLKKKKITLLKTQQSNSSYNLHNNNIDDSITTQEYKMNTQHKNLLDVEIAKAEIYDKWVPQAKQRLVSQNSAQNLQLNLSQLNQKTLLTQDIDREQNKQINASSSQNLSERKKIKYFKENEDKRKGKEMVKKNQQVSKQGRKFGTFVEFSKVGPARSIACLQTRIDHLINQNPHNQANKLPLQVYSAGTPIERDITSWKISRPQSSHSFFVSSNVKKQSNERANKVITKLNVELEKDTKEQIEGRNFKIRSNLDTVVKNIRNINLNQTHLSSNRQTNSQYQNTSTTLNSPKLVLDFLSPRGVSPSLTLNSPSGIFSNREFLSPSNGFQKSKEAFSIFGQQQKEQMRDSIKEEENLQSESSSPPTSPITQNVFNKVAFSQQKLTLNISSSKFATATHSPNCHSEDFIKFEHKRSNFLSIGNRDELGLEGNKQIENDYKINKIRNHENNNNNIFSSPASSQNKFYSKSQNDIEITTQLLTQKQLRSKINSVYEQKKQAFQKNRSHKVQPKSDAILSFVQQHSEMKKKHTKTMSLNKQLNMKAIDKALIEIEDQEYQNDKHMFDPNLEWIKKKRRIKQKLIKLLIKCSKMKVKAKDINKVSVFSTVPYENKGAYSFLECIKRGKDQLVIELIDKNPYYISDFDQIGLTGLHHACKKENLFLVRYLIQKGSDIDAQDTMGRTPLYYALISENIQIIKELLIMKCSPWTGDRFTFLSQNLPKQILLILQFVKELNIVCKLQKNHDHSEKIWKSQIQYIHSI